MDDTHHSRERAATRAHLSRLAAAMGFALTVVALVPPVAHAETNLFGFPWFGQGESGYALDGVARRGQGIAICQPEQMVAYRGTTLRYSGPARAHPAFVERLPEFERVVTEVAIETYGRAPRRVLSMGAFNCRSVRGNETRLSEHALGNALDVRGFEFAALRRRDPSPEGMPSRLRRGFTVTVDANWSPRVQDERTMLHAAFLRRLVDRLARENVFRVIYGPAHPGHQNHFHFDMSPFRWIHV